MAVAIAALALAAPAAAQIERPERLLSSVVGLHAMVPADARTAGSLGTERHPDSDLVCRSRRADGDQVLAGQEELVGG